LPRRGRAPGARRALEEQLVNANAREQGEADVKNVNKICSGIINKFEQETAALDVLLTLKNSLEMERTRNLITEKSKIKYKLAKSVMKSEQSLKSEIEKYISGHGDGPYLPAKMFGQFKRKGKYLVWRNVYERIESNDYELQEIDCREVARSAMPAKRPAYLTKWTVVKEWRRMPVLNFVCVTPKTSRFDSWPLVPAGSVWFDAMCNRSVSRIELDEVAMKEMNSNKRIYSSISDKAKSMSVTRSAYYAGVGSDSFIGEMGRHETEFSVWMDLWKGMHTPLTNSELGLEDFGGVEEGFTKLGTTATRVILTAVTVRLAYLGGRILMSKAKSLLQRCPFISRVLALVPLTVSTSIASSSL
jgi:hypothetical protein